MENDMINFSISTSFPFVTSLKEKPKIEMVTFIKQTEKQIEERRKKALAIYDFTNYEKKGKVVGILEKGRKHYHLIITSTGVISFPEDSTHLFDFGNPNLDFGEVETFVFENVDTNNVKNMAQLFLGLEKIKQLDLSMFSTKNVISMYEMFYGCSSLTELNIKHFDTSNVEEFSAMFGACSNLENININHFNTKRAKQIYWMFSSCEKLKELDISNFETPKIEYMFEMFQACYAMKRLDISNFTFDNIVLGDKDNDRVFVEMPEDAIIIVKSEKEREAILGLDVYHRPEKWNQENIIVKEKVC